MGVLSGKGAVTPGGFSRLTKGRKGPRTTLAKGGHGKNNIVKHEEYEEAFENWGADGEGL